MEGTAAGWSTLALDSMNILRLNGQFTDVAIMSKDGYLINAQSVVLAAGSGHFKDALHKVRSSGSFATVMIKLAYSNSTIRHIINFLYSGKISVPESEMEEIKTAAKGLTIPALEALCDTYTKNLEQFMQANEIPQDSEVSIEITHQLNSEEDQASQDSPSQEGSVAVELTNDADTSDHGEEDVEEEEEEDRSLTLPSTLQLDPPAVQTVQITPMETEEGAVETEAISVGGVLVSGVDGESQFPNNASDVNLVASEPIITNVVSLEEVTKTVSIESLLANQTTISVPEVFTKMDTEALEEEKYEKSSRGQIYRYRCNICAKDFSSLYRLKGHHATHFGEKAHQCGICGKRYIQIEYLREHESIHTNEKPFKCEVCHKAFRINRHLKKHMITHSDKRPYVCTICDKTFQRSDRLKAHIRTHTGEKPYRCEYCGRKFSLHETLVKHKDSHTDNRPFQCSICIAEFKRKDALLTHMEIHRSDRRFQCGVADCKASYNQCVHLKKHLLNNHKVQSFDNYIIERPRMSSEELAMLMQEIKKKKVPTATLR